MTYSFLRKKLDEYILLSILVLSIPLTVFLARHIQLLKQEASSQCIPQPTCLTVAPLCYLGKPTQGWCTQKAPVFINATSPMSCSDCLYKNLRYQCKNIITGATICSNKPTPEDGFSCIICPTAKPSF